MVKKLKPLEMMVNKIVIIEDSEENRKIAKILMENGYKVEINPSYLSQEAKEQSKLFESMEKLRNQFKDLNIESSNQPWYRKFNKK